MTWFPFARPVRMPTLLPLNTVAAAASNSTTPSVRSIPTLGCRAPRKHWLSSKRALTNSVLPARGTTNGDTDRKTCKRCRTWPPVSATRPRDPPPCGGEDLDYRSNHSPKTRNNAPNRPRAPPPQRRNPSPPRRRATHQASATRKKKHKTRRMALSTTRMHPKRRKRRIRPDHPRVDDHCDLPRRNQRQSRTKLQRRRRLGPMASPPKPLRQPW